MPTTSSNPLDAAVALHQSGQINAAADAYRRILEQSPDDSNALHLLGVTSLQSGKPEQAVELIRRAIDVRPNVGVYHLNLAAALRALRRIDEAIAEAEKAIALDPKNAAAGYHVAAVAFADEAQIDDAIFCLEKAVEADPEFVRGYLELAAMLDRVARTREAVAARDAALAAAEKKVAAEPESGGAYMLLAQALEAKVRHDDATAAYRTASKLSPRDPAIFYGLGASLQQRGQRDEAVMCLKIALRSNPNYADARVKLAELLDEQGNCVEAANEFRAAIAHAPDHPQAHSGLGHALTHMGQADHAIAELRRAVDLSPLSPEIHSSLLMTMHYSDRSTPAELFDQHREWAKRHAEPVTRNIEPLANTRDPERPLRIGLISADFRRHPVAKFIEPVLEHHDRQQFFCVCYADVSVTDDVTERLKKHADGWRNVLGASDAQVAQKIRDDGIDVMIDLSGHTGWNRLLALARRAAPVQITQFAYPDTTGAPNIDYRITDALADPIGASESLHTEKLARLPRVAWCYRPHDESPIVTPGPGGANAPITFGSVNALAKLSSRTLATWARLLEAVPRSRLLILANHRNAEHYHELLRARGEIDPARVTVVPRRPAREYLDLFGNIDIALDPFPYNGGVTTCDTLWMGVPLVTLAGNAYVSRQGVSLLTNVGLSDLIAASEDDYIRTAQQLAEDRDRLVSLRKSLRDSMRQSAICDETEYTNELQSVWRDTWRTWCSQDAPESPPAA